ncbi:MAG: glycosyltransferase [Pirellulales bacterium]
MTIESIALIYDDGPRPDTTGVHCLDALKELVRVELFRPQQFESIPRRGFDFYLNIDDGLRYELPVDLHPSAWWAIDTHIDFDWSLSKAKTFDFVFAAQRNGAERLRREGISTAQWLPLALNPRVHRRHEVLKTLDVAFVGNQFPGPRADLLRLIQWNLSRVFVGQAYGDEMARIYSSARIVFNRSVADDVNMRVFEGVGCGSLVLTNNLAQNGQDDLLRRGTHLETYDDAEELLDKIRYYRGHEPARERIAAAGLAEGLARHTYAHRMRQLLSAVEREVRAHTSLAVVPQADDRNGSAAASTNGSIRSVAANFTSHGEKGLNPARARNDRSYYQFARPEIAGLVPVTARRGLDVGCGAGRLGEAIKRRQPCEVVGIEMNERAASAARLCLDEVIVEDAESPRVDFAQASFDFVTCADVLEHLRQPRQLLQRIRRWLKPSGCLVASIPNVAHHGVVTGLLEGNWTYEPAGLLDQTHLAFFTRREIERLLYRAGFEIASIEPVPGAGYDEWQRAGSPPEVKIGPLHISGLVREDAEAFYTYQYLVVAEPAELPRFGLTSIVMVTRDALAYTRQCVESIRAYTDEPYELIAVDNGSTDGTYEYLASLPGISLIGKGANEGFAAAANAGIEACQGEQVLLLNNDVLVTTGWLRRLLEALHSQPDVALVGPMTNCTAGAQRIEAPYLELDDLDDFAWTWAKRHDRARVDAPQLSAFCLLFRKELVTRIGLLDERYKDGLYADLDFCRRAHLAGLRAVIARDAYVHHFGHRSFMAARLDQDALAVAARRVFEEKWASAERQERCPPPPLTHRQECARCRSGDHSCNCGKAAGRSATRFRQDLVSEFDAESGAKVARRSTMRFQQDFVSDFDQFDLSGPPFAFVRFGDGERAICCRSPVVTQDGWSYPGGDSAFADQLMAALCHSGPDYYVGISDACCDPASHDWYLKNVRVPLERLTFANIFVNGNYPRFRELLRAPGLSGAAIVSSEGGDFHVPADILGAGQDFDVDDLVRRLLHVDRPMLVSAGPASCIIIHRYWQQATNKQVILDVGSAIDERTKGRKTRAYQIPGTPKSELICTW